MLKSTWVENDVENDHFPLQNLPYGVFSSDNSDTRHIGVAIHSYVLDLHVLYHNNVFRDLNTFDASVVSDATLNRLMSLDRFAWKSLRIFLTDLLDISGINQSLKSNTALRQKALIRLNSIRMHLPCEIGDYTDFYSSREHATNVGIMFRGIDNALQPNWLYLPVGYHGRSSSVVISGTEVVRPSGQLQLDPKDPTKGAIHSPCKLLDFELEIGYFVGGKENQLGQPVTMQDAEDRIFGLVLLNDWSARDIQAWEYVPLGPFTAKNFCTSISPWIVTLDALEEFRCSSSAGAIQGVSLTSESSPHPDPRPLDYLFDPNYATSSFDIKLDVFIRGQGDEFSSLVSSSNMKYLYWNIKQQLVHHSVTGCNMRPGDLLGTGTISGPTDASLGSMLELSWRGSREVILDKATSGDHSRKFLKDGDEVIMTGVAEGNGYKIGFGSVSGVIIPSGSIPVRVSTGDEDLKAVYEGTNVVSNSLTLYSYWRSSSSHRVRIALNLKGLAYNYKSVNLAPLFQNSVNQLPDEFTSLTPSEQLPLFEYVDTCDKPVRISQSVAIIEFIDECFHRYGVSLMPKDPVSRARARQIVEIVNSGIQPFHNVRFIRQVDTLQLAGVDASDVDGKAAFMANTIRKGLHAIESLVSTLWAQSAINDDESLFCLGTSQPTIADIFLIPCVYSAKRFFVDVNPNEYPCICKVFNYAESLPAFANASPSQQPDAVLG